jgi:hypothetical protein
MQRSMNRRRNVLAGATFLAAAAFGLPAAAAPAKLVAGTLTCKGKGTVGMILGSQESLNCVFQSPNGLHHSRYFAKITKFGLDIGIKGESTLVWTVLSTTTDLPRNALEGNYGGATAGVAIGVGGSANVLIGGSNDSVVLQPLSVEGQTGLNVSAGVSGLSLRRS